MAPHGRESLQIQPTDGTRQYFIEACHATSGGYQYQLAGEADGRRVFLQVSAENVTDYVSALQLEDFETSRIDQTHLDAFQAVWGGKAPIKKSKKAKKGRTRQCQRTALREPLQQVAEIIDCAWSDPSHHPPGHGDEAILLYLVRWHDSETSWEPAGNIHEAAIRDYEARQRGMVQSPTGLGSVFQLTHRPQFA